MGGGGEGGGAEGRRDAEQKANSEGWNSRVTP